MDNLEFARNDEYRPGLTDEERAAIEAFPADKVQKIPEGASGINHEYRWFPSKAAERYEDNFGGGALRLVDKETGKKLTLAQLRKIKQGQSDAAVKARWRENVRKAAEARKAIHLEKLALVREAIAGGARSYKEIADYVGCADSTVGTYLRDLNIDWVTFKLEEAREAASNGNLDVSAGPRTGGTHSRNIAIAERNKEIVRAAIDAGHITVADLMAATGMGRSTVSKHCKRLGVNLIALQKQARQVQC